MRISSCFAFVFSFWNRKLCVFLFFSQICLHRMRKKYIFSANERKLNHQQIFCAVCCLLFYFLLHLFFFLSKNKVKGPIHIHIFIYLFFDFFLFYRFPTRKSISPSLHAACLVTTLFLFFEK